MVKMLYDFFRFKNEEFIQDKDDDFSYKLRMKVMHCMPGKKTANLTTQMFPPVCPENEKGVPVKPKNVNLEDVMLKFDKDVYERDFCELQEFNKKLLYKFHNMFA